jgi:hypothetical protein
MILLRRLAVLSGFALSVVACGGNSRGAQCPKGAEGAVEKSAKTGVAGVKTGVRTGVEGVKTFGGAVGGFVSGGSDEAKAKWNEGKKKTRQTAREGADETERTSQECP